MNHRATNRLGAILVQVLLLCATRTASAQSQTPAQVAQAFFNALAAERWRDAASLLDLESFDAYRKDVVKNARHPYPTTDFTAEMLLKHDSTMPRAVAEYQAAQMKRFRDDSASVIGREFANTRSPGELESLSVLDAAARMLEAVGPRYQVRQAMSELPKVCRDSAKKALPKFVVLPDSVLGVVVRDSVAHVLHERSGFRVIGQIADTSLEQPAHRMAARTRDWISMPPAVMELRRVRGRWLIGGEIGGPGSGAWGESIGFDCPAYDVGK
jgi:hypothetical protein